VGNCLSESSECATRESSQPFRVSNLRHGVFLTLLAFLAFSATAQVVRPLVIPGRVQAEDYDTGGSGISYSDDGAGNAGNVYRTDNVDLEPTTDTGGGYNVGWISSGEWLNYTVDVKETAIYTFAFRAASPSGSGNIQISVDNLPFCSTSTPYTGGWQSWQTVTLSNLVLRAGHHLLHVVFQTGGFNLNYIDVAKQRALTGGFLRASGKQLVDGQGNNVLLRGMGIGNWMIQEPYMMDVSGIVDTQQQLKAKIAALVGANNMQLFYAAWLSNYFRAADVQFMAQAGFNSIRLPMHYDLFTLPAEQEPLPGQNTWLTQGFQMVDDLLGWCESNHIYLILDMHAAPGGQGHNASISDYNPPLPSLLESPTNQAKLVSLWRKLAERYSNRQWLGGYDLINEPNWSFENLEQTGCSDANNIPLHQLLIDMTTAIRQVDTNHILFLEGNCWASNYRGLLPAWDDNMVISFHKYWDDPTLASLQKWTDMRDQWNMPLWLGESGENSNDWFRATIRCSEQVNLGWSWWPWKKLVSNAGTLTVTEPAGYRAILNYWRGNGARPSTNVAFASLMQLADATRFENCTIHRDVLDALFRPNTAGVTLPFNTNTIPGYIFAPDYDLGPSGEAYFDSTNTAGNEGAAYRNDSVDIQAASDPAGIFGYNVGWTDPGEWLKYTLNAIAPGPYTVSARVAGGNAGGLFYLESGGVNISGNINVPPTGGWQNWTTLPARTLTNSGSLDAVRLVILSAGFNLEWLKFDTLAAPRLSAKTGDGSIQLAWPTWASSYSVYATSNLAPLITWSPLTNASVEQNGELTMNVSRSAQHQFFRLQR
jgi:hypothetical protein